MSPKQLYDNAINAGINGDFATSVRLLSEAKSIDSANMPILSALALANEADLKQISKEAGVAVFQSINSGNKHHWNEALRYAKRACGLSANSALLWVHIGTVYVGLIQAGKGDHYAGETINAYKKAITIDSQNGLAYFNLGVAQAATRNWLEARINILKAKSLGIPVPAGLLSEIESRLKQQKK